MKPESIEQQIDAMPVKERDDLNLFNLVCELSGRFAIHQNETLHKAYVEARTEMEARIAGRSASIEIEKQKDERIKELEDGLHEIKNKCSSADDSFIATVIFVSSKAKQLLNNQQ